jgi:hypothetical protein
MKTERRAEVMLAKNRASASLPSETDLKRIGRLQYKARQLRRFSNETVSSESMQWLLLSLVYERLACFPFPITCTNSDDEQTPEQESEYRILFLDRMGGVTGRMEFYAAGDRSARIVACALSDACMECYEGYQLWSRSRCIVNAPLGPRDTPPLPLHEMTLAIQKTIADLKHLLRLSNGRVSQSRRFLEMLKLFQESIASPNSSPRQLINADIRRCLRKGTYGRRPGNAALRNNDRARTSPAQNRIRLSINQSTALAED